MKRIVLKYVFALCFMLGNFVWISAQTDSIYLGIKISEDRKKLEVYQEINYQNTSEKPLDSIKLLNFIAAYQKRGTSLVNRQLEDRNTKLHFAKKNELGKLQNLNIEINSSNIEVKNFDKENIYIPLQKPLAIGERLNIALKYQLDIPNAKFTKYGVSESNTLLKYFFLVPDHYDVSNKKERNYIDIEEGQTFNTYWRVNFGSANNIYIESNLPQNHYNSFEGFLQSDPEFIIAAQNYSSIKVNTDDIDTEIRFGYHITSEERSSMEFYLPLQLKFIKDRIGTLPKKIFISEKFRSKEDFVGIDDLSFWKFNFQLFSDREKIDLDYFGIISKKIIDESFITDKQTDHWFKNGLKSYLEIEYLKKFYNKTRLLGTLPETLSIWKIKPLKLFHASKLDLLERYGLAYQYIMKQNLDQKIGEKFSKLSNFNDMAISGFETGTLFAYHADKMGPENFDSILKNYLQNHSHQKLQPKDFLTELSNEDPSADYLSRFFDHKNRVNFKLKNFKRDDEKQTFNIRVSKDTPEAIPFKLQTETKDGQKQTYWIETEKDVKEKWVEIPSKDIYKIKVNNGYMFPEDNFDDNFLFTKGIFSNMRKVRFKLITDIPKPEYTEIYIAPKIRFSNTYDKFLIGLNFKNKSLFDQKFLYSLSPNYSTGTGKLTGGGSVVYNFLPAEGIFRKISFGTSASYYHYDHNLAYKKVGFSSGWDFRKNPRSTITRSFGFSYNHYQKDLDEARILNNDYEKYNLWSLGYSFVDNMMIHEKSMSFSTQWMEDFHKITAEGFYRWEFTPKQKLSVRLFAGYFIKNNTRNNFFDYGISRVSNYSFSYSLLGESATSGILAQQFVLADGGFKSIFPQTANQWIGSVNIDSGVWSILHVYADAGVFKSKGKSSEFIWGTGLKVRVIPDFLEVYLPVQSSLGFEPSFKDYGKRIRYTLVLNLSTIINAARRGLF